MQASICPHQNLLQVGKELLPPMFGALVSLLLVWTEARLLHAQLCAGARGGESPGDDALKAIGCPGVGQRLIRLDHQHQAFDRAPTEDTCDTTTTTPCFSRLPSPGSCKTLPGSVARLRLEVSAQTITVLMRERLKRSPYTSTWGCGEPGIEPREGSASIQNTSPWLITSGKGPGEASASLSIRDQAALFAVIKTVITLTLRPRHLHARLGQHLYIKLLAAIFDDLVNRLDEACLRHHGRRVLAVA